jgi:fatty-acyl-CoA synthase
VARSQWAVIVDPDTSHELPDGEVGEIWLQGSNIARGYWGLPDETRSTFGAELGVRLTDGSHADGSVVDGRWLRTGDLGVYLDGELYVTGRIADLLSIDGRHHYPQDIEATAAEASPVVRRGYATAFCVLRAPAASIRNRRLMRSSAPCWTDTASSSAMCVCCRRALSPEPPAESWPAEPAALSTWTAHWAVSLSYRRLGQ